MTWRSISPKSRDNAIVGRTRVNVRLATTQWVGRTGKIYMALPAETTGSIKIAWRSHGLFLDGAFSCVPGELAPKFHAAPPLEDEHVALLAATLRRRVTRYLERRGRLPREEHVEHDDAPPEPKLLECAVP